MGKGVFALLMRQAGLQILGILFLEILRLVGFELCFGAWLSFEGAPENFGVSWLRFVFGCGWVGYFALWHPWHLMWAFDLQCSVLRRRFSDPWGICSWSRMCDSWLILNSL